MNQDIKVKLTFDYPKETPTLWSPRVRLRVVGDQDPTPGPHAPGVMAHRSVEKWLLDNCRALSERIFGTPCHRQEFLFYIDCRVSSALPQLTASVPAFQTPESAQPVMHHCLHCAVAPVTPGERRSPVFSLKQSRSLSLSISFSD